jgi:hypothetical protein
MVTCKIYPLCNGVDIYVDNRLVGVVSQDMPDCDPVIKFNERGANAMLSFGDIEIIMDNWEEMQEQRWETIDPYENDSIHGKTQNT